MKQSLYTGPFWNVYHYLTSTCNCERILASTPMPQLAFRSSSSLRVCSDCGTALSLWKLSKADGRSWALRMLPIAAVIGLRSGPISSYVAPGSRMESVSHSNIAATGSPERDTKTSIRSSRRTKKAASHHKSRNFMQKQRDVRGELCLTNTVDAI